MSGEELEPNYDPSLLYMWKVKPCKKEGYYRTYYVDTPEGDHIEVDFNNTRNMVQITLILEKERGREYIAVIKSGTIIRERDVTSSRPIDLSSRLFPFREFFGFLRDDQALRSIGGNYGIPEKPFSVKIPRLFRSESFQLKKPSLRERLQNYLRKKRNRELMPRPFYMSFLRRMPAELLDLALGGALVLAYFYNLISLTELAGFAGFLGIAAGALDWVWRQRNPFLPKVAALMSLSALAVYYDVLYRNWSIF